MLNRLHLSTLVLFMLMAALCHAQSNLPSPEALKLQFPDSKSVMLAKNEHLHIDYKAGKWNIESKVDENTLYLSDAQLFSQKSIFITGFDDITKLEAKTVVPIKKGKKTEYQIYPVQKVETKDVMMGSVFYSDYKEKKFVFPALQNGASTQLSYTQTNTEPRLLNAFYFSNYTGPVLSSVYSVTFPKNIQIAYKLLGENVENIAFEQTEKNNLITYTWRAKDVADLKPEADAPSSSYYQPHVVVYITKLTDGKDEQNILENIDGLYRWYYSLVKNINQQPDETQQQIVADLIKDAPTDTEKAKRIYQWVQSHIKYIAFEDGLGGFIPRQANEVCAKKYGDCKDMASILVQMLKLAGLPAYYTWIGSRDKPYSYYDVPSPIVDNHMIATTKLNGQYIFLDATGEYQAFGMPTSMIQGKEALIGIDNSHYEVIKVPIIPMEENTETDNLTLTLNPATRTLNGTGSISYTGYKKVFAQYDKLRADAAGKSARFYNEYLRKGSNKFETQTLTPTGFNNNSAPEIKIDYAFSVPDYVTKAGDKLYINLNLNRKYQQSSIDKKERKLDKEIEYQYVEDFTYNLQIPDGYAINSLPPDATYTDAEFGYTATYTQNPGSVTLHLRLYINHLMLKKSRFDAWNSMIEQLNNTYQEVVVLKEK